MSRAAGASPCSNCPEPSERGQVTVETHRAETTKRVLVVDDDARVRQALRALIESCEGLMVSGEAASGPDAKRADEEAVADVVLLDVFLPSPEEGLGVLADLVARGRRVVALSIHGELGRAVLALGAVAFVEKSAGPDVLVDALRIASTSTGSADAAT